MEITRTNFTEKLDEIGEAIKEASFLAIDGEFTGLEKPGCSHAAPFDTPEERYIKIRETSLDFLLVQFGLCAFKFKEETQSYEARPFNFYVFPRPYTRQAPDRRFLCQSSSIDFLVQQGFDFNKMFREGIPYLTPVQEDEMREALNMKHQAFSKFSSPAFFSPDTTDMGPGKGPVMVPDDQKEFIATTCDKISKFLEDKGGPESMQLDPCNAFQRKLLYQTVRTKFSAVHLETKTGEKKERFIVVTRVSSDEELKKKEKDKQNAEIMELEEAVGFSKVIKLISQSGKPVLGHNMMLDVMHMLNQFVCPVPEHLEEFKSMVRCCLPRLIDTKFMASSHPFRDMISSTVLDHLHQTLQKEPFTPAKVELPDDFKHYENTADKQHEAGYDALVTGTVFATMANFLGKKEDNPKPVVEPSSSLLEPFLNKLFLMRLNDIPYLNLAGPEPVPNRDHVFHITFPREWKASEINNLFSAFGNIFISWISETSAFVSLYKKDNADAVLKSLGESRTLYRLLTYKAYRSTLAPPPPAGTSLPPPSLSSASACAPVPPSKFTTPNRTTLKRSAPRDHDENKMDQSELQPVSKKLCSVDSKAATNQAVQSPDAVHTSQVANKAEKSEDADVNSTEMFDVPANWS